MLFMLFILFSLFVQIRETLIIVNFLFLICLIVKLYLSSLPCFLHRAVHAAAEKAGGTAVFSGREGRFPGLFRQPDNPLPDSKKPSAPAALSGQGQSRRLFEKRERESGFSAVFMFFQILLWGHVRCILEHLKKIGMVVKANHFCDFLNGCFLL